MLAAAGSRHRRPGARRTGAEGVEAGDRRRRVPADVRIGHMGCRRRRRRHTATPIAAYQGQVAVADMFGGSIRTASYFRRAVGDLHRPRDRRSRPDRGGGACGGVRRRHLGLPLPEACSIPPTRCRATPSRSGSSSSSSSGARAGCSACTRSFAAAPSSCRASRRRSGSEPRWTTSLSGITPFPTAAEAVHYAAEAAIAGELVGALPEPPRTALAAGDTFPDLSLPDHTGLQRRSRDRRQRPGGAVLLSRLVVPEARPEESRRCRRRFLLRLAASQEGERDERNAVPRIGRRPRARRS